VITRFLVGIQLLFDCITITQPASLRHCSSSVGCQMDPKVIQITATVRQDRDRSLAIWMGELDEFGDQVWIFLPKKEIQYEIRGASVKVVLPYWLAKRNNLLPSVVRRVGKLEERVARIEEHLGLNKSRH
jgi:hypothetical protein